MQALGFPEWKVHTRLFNQKASIGSYRRMSGFGWSLVQYGQNMSCLFFVFASLVRALFIIRISLYAPPNYCQLFLGLHPSRFTSSRGDEAHFYASFRKILRFESHWACLSYGFNSEPVKLKAPKDKELVPGLTTKEQALELMTSHLELFVLKHLPFKDSSLQPILSSPTSVFISMRDHRRKDTRYSRAGFGLHNSRGLHLHQNPHEWHPLELCRTRPIRAQIGGWIWNVFFSSDGKYLSHVMTLFPPVLMIGIACQSRHCFPLSSGLLSEFSQPNSLGSY